MGLFGPKEIGYTVKTRKIMVDFENEYLVLLFNSFKESGLELLEEPDFQYGILKDVFFKFVGGIHGAVSKEIGGRKDVHEVRIYIRKDDTEGYVKCVEAIKKFLTKLIEQNGDYTYNAEYCSFGVFTVGNSYKWEDVYIPVQRRSYL